MGAQVVTRVPALPPARLRLRTRAQRTEGARASWVSLVPWCLSVLLAEAPADNKQMKAAAGPVPPRWEESAAQRAGPAGRGLPLLPRHLIWAVVGPLPLPSLPQGRIEHKPERQKPLRGHPLTAVPNRRSETARRAPPCLSVCSAFSHSSDTRRQL